jgi:hypothetical protein
MTDHASVSRVQRAAVVLSHNAPHGLFDEFGTGFEIVEPRKVKMERSAQRMKLSCLQPGHGDEEQGWRKPRRLLLP